MPHTSRLSRLQASLIPAGLDAMIVSSPAHIHYLTDVSGPSMLVVVSPAEARVLVHFVDLALADSRLKGIRLQRYDDRLETLAEVLSRWSARRVGFEAEVIAHAEYLRWCERLPDLHLLPADSLITQLRGRTDPVELVSLRRAADLADQALASVLGQLRPGVSEGTIAGEIARLLLGGGAERLAYLLVQFGRNTAQPQARPGPTFLQPGDLVLLDLAPVVGGAWVSLARTIVLGEAQAEQRRAYSVVQQARFAALHQVRAGVASHLVDRAAREVIASAGYGRYFGHPIGRALQGGATIGPASTRPLEEGMVITIGPGIYIPGWGGIRLEDTVVVHGHGCDVLSYSTTDLVELPLTGSPAYPARR
jgi:Xaa-Pro aminopeptidase